MIKVSVIVPVYRLGSMVSECLESLRAQVTRFPVEFLILDDASPDDSWERIQAVAAGDERFWIWRNKMNKGLAFNMRILLSHAAGEYLAYLDGDDLALPGKLQTLADYLDEHPSCAIAYHESEVFRHGADQTLYLYSRDHYNAQYVPCVANIEHLVRYGCFLNASSVMFRRHPHLTAVVDSQCRILLDYPMHIFNAGYLEGTIDRIDQVLGRYRLHPNSACGQNTQSVARRLQVVEDQLRAVDNARRFGVPARVLAAGRAHHRFAAALFFLKQGQDELFRTLIEAASRDGVFFDERHRQTLRLRHEPQQVRDFLFGGGAA